MAGRFFDWLDHRTGFRKLMDAMLLEHIPGGAKWRYVWGSALAFVFTVQLITGVLLMLHYSPGDSTAWGSVYYIQYEMDFGWLIRGLHHFGSQTMVVLLGVHMLQVAIAGAHLAPREINWWLGLGLLGIVLGLSLTGYLLPWDQKGFWATQVATNIAGNLPGLGPIIQRIVVGGTEYGHHTLTHFYALHVGVLPPLLIALLIAHIAVFRRHGVTAPANARGEDYFWPAQAFRDMVVSMIVFGVMLALVVFGGHGHKLEDGINQQPDVGLYEYWAKAGQDGRGANLDAPADPDRAYPARPEWYFLFLFQLLKYFEGDLVMIGTMVIPNGVMVLLFLLPLLGYGRMRPFGHFFGVLVVTLILVGAGVLTFLAIVDDSEKPIFGLGGTEKAKNLQKEFRAAEALAQRAVNLAHTGIPEEGGRYLLRGDPKTKGRVLFGQHCAVCHMFSLDRPDGDFKGFIKDADKKDDFKAADLGGYGSEKWIRGLLDNPSDPHYFGQTQLTGMKGWKKNVMRDRKRLNKEEIAQEEKDLDAVAQFLADQSKPKDKRDAGLAKKVRETWDNYCASCHAFPGEKGESTAPDLTDYGSQEWIRFMIMEPAHPLRHGAKNEMPAFRNLDSVAAGVHQQEFFDVNKDFPKDKLIHLSDFDRELIIRFMTGDYRVVFGGKEVAGPPRK